MELALYILGGYLILALISKVFAIRRKKALLTLQAEVTELKVDITVIPKEDWATFDKNEHRGKAIQYVLAYDHPSNTEEKTEYILYEVVPLKDRKYLQRVKIPLDKPFPISVSAKKPQKVEIKMELSFKEVLDEKLKEVDTKKK